MQHGQRIAPGRVVHFVLADGGIRPAQCVRIWGPDPTGEDIRYDQGAPAGMYSAIQLLVSLDGTNDTGKSSFDIYKGQIESIKERYAKSEDLQAMWTLGKAVIVNAPAHPFYYPHVHEYEGKENISICSTVSIIEGFFAWATSVAYDPYDWRPGTWHWPQDKKLVKPASIQHTGVLLTS